MDLPIENFRKLFSDFLVDLNAVYPELNDNIESVNLFKKNF